MNYGNSLFESKYGKTVLANQKEEIMRFAEKNGLSIDKWYTETVSGSVSTTKDRKLSELLKRMHPGDTLIVTRISRLSRTLLGDYDYPEFLH